MASPSTTRRIAVAALAIALSFGPSAPLLPAQEPPAESGAGAPPQTQPSAPPADTPGGASSAESGSGAAPSGTWPAGSLGRQIGQDLKHVFTRPFELRGKEWILPGALAAGTVALYSVRKDIRDNIQDHRSDSRDQFFQDVRITGKGAFVPALAAILATVGWAADSSREKQTALLLIESMAATGAYTGIGQTVLASERPEVGDSVRFFRSNGHGVSGDVALSASMLGPLDRAYFRPRPGESGGRKAWRRVGRGLLYLAPALVAGQRMDADKHWAPDVYLGYAIGLLTGRTLCASYDAAAPGGRR